MLEEPEFAAALLVYLNALGRPLPALLLERLGVEASELPPLGRRWWQVLVGHYLFGKTWGDDPDREAHRDRLARELRKRGLLWRRELRLEESRPVTALLTTSAAKLDACVAIYELEREVRGSALRQVVLCDYIREGERDRLGAFPIFMRLIERAGPEEAKRIALLTGRLALVHASHVEPLRASANGASIDAEPMAGCPRFCRIAVRGGRASAVGLLTRLLERGAVHVLVGTRALLGEGWDAPVVNALVLASYVGSFVTTNQMRGRAIRRDPRDPSKAASVWHLVAADLQIASGLADWDGLERRFKAFVGLEAGAPVIESGLDRLRLPHPRSEAAIAELNAISTGRLRQTDRLEARWKEAIEVGTHGHVVPTVRVKRPPRRPRYYFWATLRYLLYAGAGAAYLGFSATLDLSGRAGITSEEPLLVLAVAAAAAVILSLPPLARAAAAWTRALPVDGVIRQVALAVFEALVDAGVIRTETSASAVDVQEVAPGAYAVALRGGTFYEQSVFADAVDEVLGPIGNPRYLVTRTDRRRSGRQDVHAVPGFLAANKQNAERFLTRWTRRMGPAELVYTRTPEGRARLLQARGRSFSSAFVPAAERMDRWQ